MLVRGAHDNNNLIMEFKRNCIAQLIGLVDQARGFVVSQSNEEIIFFCKNKDNKSFLQHLLSKAT